MNPREVIEHLHPNVFAPSLFVTLDGAAYEVRHPELATVTEHGTLIIYFLASPDDVRVDDWVKIGCRNLMLIRPTTRNS
jgi:hypothetical protein